MYVAVIIENEPSRSNHGVVVGLPNETETQLIDRVKETLRRNAVVRKKNGDVFRDFEVEIFEDGVGT